MKLTRIVSIEVRIGEESRTHRLEEEVEFLIEGAEAAQAVLDDPGDPTKENLKALLNRLAQFIKGVPDEEIVHLGAEARTMIADFLRTQAARFEA